MPKATTYQCPSCGGIASFDTSLGKVACSHCGNIYDGGELQSAIPLGDAGVEPSETEHVRTVEGFLERAPWKAADGTAANAVAYSCPACGAHVVADQSTVAISCPYCGNNLLVQGIATPDNMPDEVLPFSISKEAAQRALYHHFEGKPYLPRTFEAQIAHVQGVYVPYYLYDLRVWGDAGYVVREGSGDSHVYRAARRSGYAAFKRIPVDGSSKMPDAHMDAIAPFDLDSLRPFDAGFAAGYLMEVADESAEDCEARAEARVRRSFEDDLAADIIRGKTGNSIEQTVNQQTNTRVEGMGTCVLPVWLMHCTWTGGHMLFAVNGTTGRCVGDLPVDGKRRALTIGGILAATLVALALLMAVAIGFGGMGGGGGEVLGGMAGLVCLVGVFAAFAVDHNRMSQMRTAKEAISAREHYTGKGLVIAEGWSADEWHTDVSSAAADLRSRAEF